MRATRTPLPEDIHADFLEDMDSALVPYSAEPRRAVVDGEVYVHLGDFFALMGLVHVNFFDLMFPMRHAEEGRPLGRYFDDRFLVFGVEGAPSVEDGIVVTTDRPSPASTHLTARSAPSGT